MNRTVESMSESTPEPTLSSTLSSTSETTLFVAAVDGEVQSFPSDLNVLITGIGSVNATLKLTEYLATSRERGELPERVVNVGTAGALVDGMAGVFEISSVLKHDFHLDGIKGIEQYLLPESVALPTSGLLPTACLATGDCFISDAATRSRLAQASELCDMEGYAIAAVCQHFDVPCTLLKQVSDSANEEGKLSWENALEAASRQLLDAVGKLGLQ